MPCFEICKPSPENPGDVAHDLGVVPEPLCQVGEHAVALERREGLAAPLAVQRVPGRVRGVMGQAKASEYFNTGTGFFTL